MVLAHQVDNDKKREHVLGELMEAVYPGISEFMLGEHKLDDVLKEATTVINELRLKLSPPQQGIDYNICPQCGPYAGLDNDRQCLRCGRDTVLSCAIPELVSLRKLITPPAEG